MSFKVAKPVSVHDPYEWLPPHGENSVAVRTDGPDVVLSLTFDARTATAAREIRFKRACTFYLSAMPGVASLNVVYSDKPEPLGHLVQWRQSELADAWMKHFRMGSFKHYTMFFLEENKVLDVVCEAFAVSELSAEEAQQCHAGDVAKPRA